MKAGQGAAKEQGSAGTTGRWRVLAALLLLGAAHNLALLAGPWFLMLVYREVLPARSGVLLGELLVLLALVQALAVLLDWARSRALARLGLAAVLGPAETGRGDLHCALSPSAAEEALSREAGLLARPEAAAILDLPWMPIFLVLLALFHPAMGALALSGALMLVVFGSLLRLSVRRARARIAPVDHAVAELVKALRADRTLVPRTAPWLRRRRRLGELHRARLVMLLRHDDRTAFLIALMRGSRQLLQSVMLALGAWLVITQRLDPAAMLASSVLLGRMLAPLERTMIHGPEFLTGFGLWWRAAGGRRGKARVGSRAASAGEVMGTAVRDRAPPRLRPGIRRSGKDGSPLRRSPPLLELRDVRLDLPGREAPFHGGVTLALPPGRMIGITGANGSGKTLLAELVCGRRRPDRGAVVFGPALFGSGPAVAPGEGETVHSGAVQAARPPPRPGGDGTPAGGLLSIGYAPQDTASVPASLMQDLALADTDPAMRQELERLSAALGSPGLPARLVRALEEGGPLPPFSAGERRRLALARALCAHPRLVVLDQPEEGLDAAGIAALVRLLECWRQENAALLLLTGSRRLLGTCDAVMVLESGRLRACASSSLPSARSPPDTAAARRSPSPSPDGKAPGKRLFLQQ